MRGVSFFNGVPTVLRADDCSVSVKRFLGVLLSGLLPASLFAALTVETPRCEFMRDPVGIETLRPRFSWTLKESDPAIRGQRQTAVEIRVAADPDALANGTGLLWGAKVEQAEPHLLYDGKPLEAGKPIFWSVRVWDKVNQPTPWSAPARFVAALQKPADWEDARWIGEADEAASRFDDFTLAVRFILEKEAFGVLFRSDASSNGYMWQVNTVLEGGPYLRPHIQRNGNWTQSQIPLAKFFKEPLDFSKPHTLTIEAKGKRLRTSLDEVLVDDREDDAFAAGRIGLRTAVRERALIEHLTLTDAKGKRIYDFGFDRADGLPFRATRIEKGRLVLDNRTDFLGNALTKTCPRFRKTFTLPDKPIRHAFASVSGLGFYELYLNGRKVGDRVTAPANTDYRRRVFFDTLEVTELLKPCAANTAGIWLGAGYADDYSIWGWKWEAIKRAILHLKVTFEDGTSQTLVTDGTWRMTHHSPITYASLYHGEVYDAAQEDSGWCAAGQPAESPAWTSAPVLPALDILLVPAIAPPVRVVETCSPVTITEPRPGVFVADFGQNRAGWVRIRAKGPRGTTIVLRHSELLGSDGMIDPWTNRNAKSLDTFILAGTGDWETYEPRFTYHGFQFVEITGYPGRPSPADITGCAIHADVEPAGSFRCSDPTLNKLDLCAHWSMLSNLQAIPTDCPMRDERTPCQMDSQTYEETAIMHFWMPRYYEKWLGDITGGRGNPDWNGDAVTLPWLHYLHYGDPRILEEHFANMAAVTDDVARRYPDLIAKDGFGDWCAPNNGSWEGFHNQVPIVNTAIFAQMARCTADAARVLGKTEAAERYGQLHHSIREAFNRAFYRADAQTFGNGAQTAVVLPLAFRLVPEANRLKVIENLVGTIRGRDRSRVDTGIYGTRYLADVLCDIGQADLAVTLMTQPAYPGFGFMFANGATTLWEQWTFHGGMNSHNHAMFSGGADWLYTRLGGITPAQPGYAEIAIQPVFPKALTYAEASHDTVRGTCRCVWRRDTKTKRYHMSVSVPVTAEARLVLPVVAAAAVEEEGGHVTPFAEADGVTPLPPESGNVTFRLLSGTYRLSWLEP